MVGVIYLTLLPLLAYFTGCKENLKTLFALCVLLVIDIIVVKVLNLAANDFSFFTTRALFDIILAVVVCNSSITAIRKTILLVCCSVSLLINTYLCIEQGNVWVYRQWEHINLVLCEIMFITLIISAKGYSMFNSIKLYIYGALAAVGLFLIGMVKYLSNKNNKLEKELTVANNNIIVMDKVAKDNKILAADIKKTKVEAQAVQHEINKKRNDKTKPAVGTLFGDTRL